jgi:acyl-CoA synthetase (AMP-forming)/AMP-acid ligase II
MSRFQLSREVADAARSADRALEFDGAWLTWDEMSAAMARIDEVIDHATTSDQPAVGVLVRNKPVHVAALLAILRRGGCVVVINPSRGTENIRSDLADLRLPLVLGEPADVEAAAGACDVTTTASFVDIGAEPRLTERTVRITAEPGHPGVAVRMLTSGTTGPPKRVDLGYDALYGGVAGAKHYESGKRSAARPRGVALVNSPLAHLGGVFRVLQCVLDRRPFVLLERFEVEPWLRAVRRYRPKAVSLVPAALRMVLEASPDPEDLAGVKAVTSGTAPLSPDDADAFTTRFGVPVLTSYAATEFAGGVAGWTLRDHQRHWKHKRGSVGRAQPGCALRIVDEVTGQPLPPDEPGLLEVKPAQLGPDVDWVRTTDLARIDPDGFLYILGRADHAIIRGGFKVLPEHVREVLERHPSVRGAVVVGVPDARLGAVPVALVELRPDAHDDVADILAMASTSLARYELPTRIEVVRELPRTPSGKVDLVAARDLLTGVTT